MTDRRAQIIVDIGINHNGNINLAKEMIRQAALIGVDVCKFQSYDPDKLFGPGGTDENAEIYKSVKPLDFSKNQLAELKEACDIFGVEFMCSVFDEERFSWVEELGVKRHKIASRVSKLDRPLAEKMMNTGKECIISLGFGAKGFDNNKETNRYLYCVSEYPTPYSSLEMPTEFARTPSHYYGFSNHVPGIGALLIACSRGAKILETHFTLDKSANGFDHVVSSSPDELRDLVKYVREIDVILRNSKY